MLKDYTNYVGSSPDDNWVRILDGQAMARLKGQLPSHSVSWGVRPEDVQVKKNLCVRIIAEDTSVNRLPTFVLESSDIKYLEIPIHFIPFLESHSIPESVKTLSFNGSGEFELPLSFALPQIERLLIGSGRELLFTQRNFPALAVLGFRLDRKGIMLNRLASFEKLRVLIAGPCPEGIFSAISSLKLGLLRLNDSSLPTLDGIERLETLTDLFLQKWKKLTDLTPLARLPLLEDLTLTYCRNVQVAHPILEIPNLKRLVILVSKNSAFEALLPELQNRNLKELGIA